MSKYGICVICKQYGPVHRHHLDYTRNIIIVVCPKHHKLLHKVKSELEYVQNQNISLCTYLRYLPISEPVVNSALSMHNTSRYTIFSYDLLSYGYALNPDVVTKLRLSHFWHKIINYFELYNSTDIRGYRHIRLHKLSRTSINQKSGYIYVDYIDRNTWYIRLKNAMLSNKVSNGTNKDMPLNEWEAYNEILNSRA